MTRYAANTDVTAEKSRAEIERNLRRYGADQFMYGWEGERAIVAFRAQGRQVRFVLPLPDRQSPDFTHTPARRLKRPTEEAERAWEQACRQRWRALNLAILAKLEAVEAGIASFDEEFLAYMLLPNGKTVGEWTLPQLASAYDTGRMPELLPGPKR